MIFFIIIIFIVLQPTFFISLHYSDKILHAIWYTHYMSGYYYTGLQIHIYEKKIAKWQCTREIISVVKYIIDIASNHKGLLNIVARQHVQGNDLGMQHKYWILEKQSG